ncbi:MAG: divalent-cation tolerance protein CutA [Granulosicoccaceae bacterium]|jgi:periplasmic divalent cation tolerance protein
MSEINPTTAEHLLVLCTCPDHDTATQLAKTLIDEALAACVNVLPGLTSFYHWQGKCESGTEELLIIKTRTAAYPALEARLQALHPYELPEIIGVTIEAGLPGYLAWVDESCNRNTREPEQ